MPQEYRDPAGNTEMFRAFVARDEPAPEARSKMPLVVGGLAVAAVLLVALIVWLALG